MLKRLIPIAAMATILLTITAACVFSTAQPTPKVVVITATPHQPAEPTQPPATATSLPVTDTPLPSITPEAPASTPAPLVYGPEDYPAGANPLTGMTASDTALLNRRPLSVKIQLFPRGQRPTWGASLADIVYDYYQNTGMTRFHAIFYGENADRVGPIRSARLFDYHLVRMYKSILAFGGADGRVLRTFLNAEFADRLVMEGSHNCPPMCRVDPNGYNFLVTNTTQLTTYANEKGIENGQQNLKGMFFEATPPAGGQPATQAFIRFSMSAYTRWDYDPASGRYLRSQDTKETATAEDEAYAPMIDGLTDQQLAADTVVILYVAHTYAFQTHPGNAEIIDILFSGSALGYALRDGQIYEVRWNRPKESSVLYLTCPDGRAFPFKPGKTWFEVIGQSSKMTSPAAGVWRFMFGIP